LESTQNLKLSERVDPSIEQQVDGDDSQAKLLDNKKGKDEEESLKIMMD